MVFISSNGEAVRRADLGEEWKFSFGNGSLRCLLATWVGEYAVGSMNLAVEDNIWNLSANRIESHKIGWDRQEDEYK